MIEASIFDGKRVAPSRAGINAIAFTFYFFVLRIPDNKNVQPRMKNTPPMGVRMPAGPIPVPFKFAKVMAYSEPLKSDMPMMKKVLAIFRFLCGKAMNARPVMSNAKLW